MEPTFGEGDVVLWVEVDNKAELKLGDIIIYKHPTRPGVDNVCHRIIGVERRTEDIDSGPKGDNLSDPDRHWVSEELIHGLVIGVVYAARG